MSDSAEISLSTSGDALLIAPFAYEQAAKGNPDPAHHATDDRSLFTRPRQVAFLAALAATGSVRSASATAGISHQTAYRARLSSPGFRRGWEAAMLAARAQAEEVLACRALDGWEEDVVYHGEVVARRRRFSDRLLLAHLARLDRLCGDAEVAEFADRFDEVLARYEAGEDRPARPPEPAAEPVAEAAARAGPAAEPDGALSPGPWSTWSTQGAGAEDGAAIPPPLPALPGRDGAVFSEAQRLHIGLYGVWWYEGEGCLLTNWPAPADWDGEAFVRQPPDGAPVPLDEDAGLAAELAEMGDEARAEAGWLRTLTDAEEAGLEAAAAAQAQARLARRAVYHRAAFGLASPAELAALARANPDQPGPWLAAVMTLEEVAA